jgi:serpin B
MRQDRGWWKRLLGVGHADDEWPSDPRGAVRSDGTDPDRPDGPDFAGALYGRMAATPGNLVLSPAIIRLALGMAYAGAAGRTAAEMARVLCLPPGDEVHDEMAAQLDAWGALPSSPDGALPSPADGAPPSPADGALPSSPDRAVLRVVNRLWANRGHRFTDAFLARLCDSYGAPLGTLDFLRAPATSRQAINRWVSEQTGHKLKELIPPSLITPDTRLVLTSTVDFQPRWARPFDRGRTRQDAFFVDAERSVQAPFMSKIDSVLLARFRGGQLLELPCGGAHLVMDVILPEARDGLAQLEQQLCDGALATWIGALGRQMAMVSMPRFRVASELALSGVLRLLGMAGAFTWPGAELSRMDGTHELYLSEVLHHAEVEVDEQGTEAGEAAMAVGSTPRTRAPAFHADRPFLFVVRDPRTSAIVLLGRVANPA